MRNVHRLGIDAKCIITASGVVPLLNVICNIVHHFLVDTVDVLLIVSIFLRLVQQKLAKPFLSFEVGVAGLNQLIHCQILIFEYALFHCCNGVSQICRSSDIKTSSRILCSTVLHGFSAFYAALRYHGRENYRISVHMDALHQVITCSNQIVMMQNLFLERIFKFFYILKLSRIAGFKPRQFACGGINAIVQNEFNHLAHVHVTGIRRTVCSAAARSWLDAAHNRPVSCFFYGTSSSFAKRNLDCSVVIEETWICLSLLNHSAAKLN